MKPVVDIIAVTYNSGEKLSRCLKAIRRHSKETDYVLTVVNNNDTDGADRSLVKHKDRINIISPGRNLGPAGGCNLAFRNTVNEHIVCLDDDAEVTEGWLPGLLRQINANPKTGIVGCKLVYPDGIIFSADYEINPLYIGAHGETDMGQRDHVKECDCLVKTCWIMRRDLLSRVGYFDERFFPWGHEDIDYCIRTRLAGYRIAYTGKVKVLHHNLNRDGGRAQRRKNDGKFLRKWGSAVHNFPLKDSDPFNRYVAAGMRFAKNNSLKMALAEFKKAESLLQTPPIYYYRAHVLRGLRRPDEAIMNFKKYLSFNPGSFSARYHLASLYRAQGNAMESRKEFIKTLDCMGGQNAL